MITNISDRKNTYFLSIDKAFSNKIKLSLLKKVFFLYYEWHFHEFLERCWSILEYRMIFSHADLADFADFFRRTRIIGAARAETQAMEQREQSQTTFELCRVVTEFAESKLA